MSTPFTLDRADRWYPAEPNLTKRVSKWQVLYLQREATPQVYEHISQVQQSVGRASSDSMLSHVAPPPSADVQYECSSSPCGQSY